MTGIPAGIVVAPEQRTVQADLLAIQRGDPSASTERPRGFIRRRRTGRIPNGRRPHPRHHDDRDPCGWPGVTYPLATELHARRAPVSSRTAPTARGADTPRIVPVRSTLRRLRRAVAMSRPVQLHTDGTVICTTTVVIMATRMITTWSMITDTSTEPHPSAAGRSARSVLDIGGGWARSSPTSVGDAVG